MHLRLKFKRSERDGNMIRRGEIYCADLSPVVGSEQGGLRPVLVIQNDVGNRYSPTVIIAAITSQQGKAKLPTHVEIQAEQFGLPRNSVILAEQIRTIDKKRLRDRIGQVSQEVLNRVDDAISISVGLIPTQPFAPGMGRGEDGYAGAAGELS